MWRYDYDSLGRMSSKGIPGSVREYYTYDDEDRVIAILRDGVIKEMEYDAFGRVLKVWQTLPGGSRVLLEQNTYDEYPSGVTGADPKGLKTASRIAEIGPDGNVAGYTDIRISYDEKHRPVLTRTLYGGGNTLSEQTEYGFAGEVLSSTCVYTAGTRSDMLTKTFTYDDRGRLSAETSVLRLPTGASVPVSIDYEYDDLGRPSQRRTHAQGGAQVVSLTDYTLQGWVSSQEVSVDGVALFAENLRYDDGQAFGAAPQYTGLVSTREDIWLRPDAAPLTDLVSYVYDPAGRVAADIREDEVTEYSYDSRGNILSAVSGDESAVYDYAGDILTSVTMPSGQSCTFSHDALARMTYDGQTGQAITYNSLDLVGNISRNGTTLANYFYLSDGTKTRALKANGSGLVYRGPFVYRRGSDGSLTLESVSCSGGRLTSSGALLYVTDYLGSVRAVVNGSNGAVYKASDYSTFGSESKVESIQTASFSPVITLREGYTGKESQTPDFSTGYTDFGARQYSPALRRWMTPDPLSEKYYGISPYAFCSNDPINRFDPNGQEDLKLFFKGFLTTTSGVSTTLGGIAVAGMTGGLAAGLGTLMFTGGITSIGLGISMMTIGLATDPSEKNNELIENMPTDLVSILTKPADIIAGNENHEIESTVSTIFFSFDLFRFKFKTLENAYDYIMFAGETSDAYLYFWDLYERNENIENNESTIDDVEEVENL